MITIVMSTRQRDEDYIQKAIKASGVKNPQFLCYENDNQHSLTEIYNKGLAESQYDVVTFIHDDLVFEPNCKWGQKLLNQFNDTDFGILGKAGSVHVGTSAMWWENLANMVGRVYHEAVHPQQGKKMRWLSTYSGTFGKTVIPTVVVDGLLFAVHKQRIKKNFNEDIKGFHFYDVDFCLANHLEGVKIGVTFDFPITHKSVGQTNEQWEENRKQVAELYKDQLPASVPTTLIYDQKEVRVKKQPKVSIITPTKGNVDMVANLVESILTQSTYENFEFILADTGSTPEELKTLNLILERANGKLPDHFRMVQYDFYNFATINNDVVQFHTDPRSELILFCNNDIVLVNDCISRMVQTYQENRRFCGTVGARLHYADNTVQHAGIYLRKTKYHKHIEFGHFGYKSAYRFDTNTYQVPGSTAALLLVSRSMFDKVGGFNEEYKVCFEDVQLNLEMLVRGMKNYMCGDAIAYHLESQTRGKDVDAGDVEKIYGYMNQHFEKILPYIGTT